MFPTVFLQFFSRIKFALVRAAGLRAACCTDVADFRLRRGKSSGGKMVRLDTGLWTDDDQALDKIAEGSRTLPGNGLTHQDFHGAVA